MIKSVKEFLELDYLSKVACIDVLSSISRAWSVVKVNSTIWEIEIDKEVEYMVQKAKVYCLEIVYNKEIDLDILNLFIKENKEMMIKLEEESLKIESDESYVANIMYADNTSSGKSTAMKHFSSWIKSNKEVGPIKVIDSIDIRVVMDTKGRKFVVDSLK